ncbi:MAG: lytic murein transglycosylase [Epsilonproteobacteria bacterium]|nr:lytic murein transglycosylase [Campylobacterota bacterium]
MPGFASKILFILLALTINCNLLYAASNKYLVNRLEANGFLPAFIEKLNEHFIPRPIVVKKNFYHKETESQYKHYFSKRSIDRITKFYAGHKAVFDAAQKSGVNGTIIAAILFVESDFGRQIGGYNVANVYANIIAFSDLKDSKQKRRFNWAIKQMRAVQKIWKEGKIDVFRLNGSWAGAFGIPQFIPTSYLIYAKDGNGDKKADLYNLNDAAASAANFLMKEGWSSKRKLQTILHYNSSVPYAETILKLSAILSTSK